jgi:hypothetical protein
MFHLGFSAAGRGLFFYLTAFSSETVSGWDRRINSLRRLAKSAASLHADGSRLRLAATTVRQSRHA